VCSNKTVNVHAAGVRPPSLHAAPALLPLPRTQSHPQPSDQIIGILQRLPPSLHAHPAINEMLRNQPEAALPRLAAHLTTEAKSEALKTLAIAAPLAHAPHMPHETPAVLALANQFIETGQYVNYVRANQLGTLVISWSQIPGPPDHVEQNIARAVSRLAALWRRAPLLVLFIAWLLLGTVLVPLDPQLWATGFPALVGAQFVATVRGWFRRR